MKLSKARIAEFTGTSARLVADMRVAWQAWLSQDTSIEAKGQPWALTGNWGRDRKAALGEDPDTWTDAQKAAWREQRRDRLAREVRSLASVAPNDPALAADALAQVLGRFASTVAAALSEAASKTNG